MQRYNSQSGVVGVRKGVDDSVQRVPTDMVVVNLCSGDKLCVSGGGEEWIREVAEEMLEECGHRRDIVVKSGRIAEVDL